MTLSQRASLLRRKKLYEDRRKPVPHRLIEDLRRATEAELAREVAAEKKRDWLRV